MDYRITFYSRNGRDLELVAEDTIYAPTAACARMWACGARRFHGADTFSVRATNAE